MSESDPKHQKGSKTELANSTAEQVLYNIGELGARALTLRRMHNNMVHASEGENFLVDEKDFKKRTRRKIRLSISHFQSNISYAHRNMQAEMAKVISSIARAAQGNDFTNQTVEAISKELELIRTPQKNSKANENFFAAVAEPHISEFIRIANEILALIKQRALLVSETRSKAGETFEEDGAEEKE